ncbi:MAG: AhpC/TSA family protein, partial [Alistipes sp.]|nr:AhpC/TSA family protein [Alistipes sp.]
QEQQLPWISVSDLRGLASTAVGTYNVTKLPTSFLIDKNGTIVGRDIRGEELEKKLQQLTR